MTAINRIRNPPRIPPIIPPIAPDERDELTVEIMEEPGVAEEIVFTAWVLNDVTETIFGTLMGCTTDAFVGRVVVTVIGDLLVMGPWEVVITGSEFVWGIAGRVRLLVRFPRSWGIQ
jgi:hypothetical protein